MDLLSITDLSRDDIMGIINRALEFKKMKKQPQILDGKFIVTAFFEPSTRTKLSFHRAIKGLGGKVIDFIASVSAIQKGETDIDTLLTLEAMDIDAFVVRVRRNGAPMEWKNYVKVPIINGGDGTNQHPTQALLDLTTMYEHFGRLDLKVAIVGDILHSRVANSLTQGLLMFGGKVRFCGPKEFVPARYDGVELITDSLEEALDGVDVVYALRVQKERIEKLPINIDEFFRRYQINHKTIKMAPEHAVLMHPGPFNRNIEVSDNIVYSERSLILQQVKNGVYSRMAVLERVVGS
ncbi:aspartate carbamoyltransferase catalytic subunit [bacterium 3DAC]|nr:aspartate carbamoyltransferase catalytic subunit [Dictyoglomota bacterium]UZN23705.1 aspartate carbamoyltransferase catalytic subunit [bacterium 3DAC]